MQIIVDGLLTNHIATSQNSLKKNLLVLHGWQRSVADWQFLTNSKKLLSKYNIILLDLPGFGATARAAESFDTYAYADFVIAFLKKLEVSKCTLFGHSMGGRVGIILAATTDMVTKLVLVDSAGIEDKSVLTWIKIFLAKCLRCFLPSKMVRGLRGFLGSADYVASGNMEDILRKITSQDLKHLLPKIKIPTVILWGDRDKVLPLKHAKILKKDIHGARLRIVWGAGHNPQLEKPVALQQLLEEELC